MSLSTGERDRSRSPPAQTRLPRDNRKPAIDGTAEVARPGGESRFCAGHRVQVAKTFTTPAWPGFSDDDTIECAPIEVPEGMWGTVKSRRSRELHGQKEFFFIISFDGWSKNHCVPQTSMWLKSVQMGADGESLVCAGDRVRAAETFMTSEQMLSGGLGKPDINYDPFEVQEGMRGTVMKLRPSKVLIVFDGQSKKHYVSRRMWGKLEAEAAPGAGADALPDVAPSSAASTVAMMSTAATVNEPAFDDLDDAHLTKVLRERLDSSRARSPSTVTPRSECEESTGSTISRWNHVEQELANYQLPDGSTLNQSQIKNAMQKIFEDWRHRTSMPRAWGGKARDAFDEFLWKLAQELPKEHISDLDTTTPPSRSSPVSSLASNVSISSSALKELKDKAKELEAFKAQGGQSAVVAPHAGSMHQGLPAAGASHGSMQQSSPGVDGGAPHGSMQQGFPGMTAVGAPHSGSMLQRFPGMTAGAPTGAPNGSTQQGLLRMAAAGAPQDPMQQGLPGMAAAGAPHSGSMQQGGVAAGAPHGSMQQGGMVAGAPTRSPHSGSMQQEGMAAGVSEFPMQQGGMATIGAPHGSMQQNNADQFPMALPGMATTGAPTGAAHSDSMHRGLPGMAAGAPTGAPHGSMQQGFSGMATGAPHGSMQQNSPDQFALALPGMVVAGAPHGSMQQNSPDQFALALPGMNNADQYAMALPSMAAGAPHGLMQQNNHDQIPQAVPGFNDQLQIAVARREAKMREWNECNNQIKGAQQNILSMQNEIKFNLPGQIASWKLDKSPYGMRMVQQLTNTKNDLEHNLKNMTAALPVWRKNMETKANEIRQLHNVAVSMSMQQRPATV